MAAISPAICLVSASVDRCTLIIHTHTHRQRGRYSQTGRQSADTPADAAQSPVALLNMCKLCGINYYALYVISEYTNWLLHLPLCNPFPSPPLQSHSCLIRTSTTLPACRQVEPVTIYHLSMTHAQHIRTRTHTRTVTERAVHVRAAGKGI